MISFIRYLAIEYCMGTLEDLVCGGNEDFAMTDESYLPILCQITAGLNQLHSLGIVHGNLKPSNILVSFPKGDYAEPMMKLADFGIRCVVRDKATGGIIQYRLVTTDGWMCPTDTQVPISPSFDAFSLGCVYGFICLQGLHPFGSDPISRIANRQPMTMTLGQLQGSIQCHSFFDIIEKLLNFDASKRPSTVDVLNRVIFYQKQAAAIASLFLTDLSDHQQIPELLPFFPSPSNSSATLQSCSKATALAVQQKTPDVVEPQTSIADK